MKGNKGITLVALIITIIILLILAGVTIAQLSQTGLFNNSKEAVEVSKRAAIIEDINLEIITVQTRNKGNISNTELKTILVKYGEVDDEENPTKLSVDESKANEDKLKIINGYKGEILVSEIYSGRTTEGGGIEEEEPKEEEKIVTDGSYDTAKGMHTPKIEGTGLTAIYWNNNTWVELNEESSKEDWDKWYNYENKEWANAKTVDGSMWVWIPRYEYKIDATNKSIDVRFISTETKKGTAGYTTDSTGITRSSDGYIIHPAFIDDRVNGFDNGGWDKELEGFWIAKYPAGYQNGTREETKKPIDQIVYSNLNYTTTATTSNYLTASLTANSTKMSMPVFKANTYAYNLISIGDSYLLSQQVKSNSMYGLSGADSHLEKNSEYGAVVYLTHSKYGVNGNSSNMNEVAMNNESLYNKIYVNGASSGTASNVNFVTSENHEVNQSSTKNITGVFDLHGCVWEFPAGYFKGLSLGTPAWHNAMATSNTTASTKYMTLYTSDNKVGDGMNETKGWNNDYYYDTGENPTFMRGGNGQNGDLVGIFAYIRHSTYGRPWDNSGFRVCLIF